MRINDGGPAFPVPGFLSPMETSEALAYDNKPQVGMTLRDWFAGQALAGEMASQSASDGTWTVQAVENGFDDCAAKLYLIADKMIAARERMSQ